MSSHGLRSGQSAGLTQRHPRRQHVRTSADHSVRTRSAASARAPAALAFDPHTARQARPIRGRAERCFSTSQPARVSVPDVLPRLQTGDKVQKERPARAGFPPRHRQVSLLGVTWLLFPLYLELTTRITAPRRRRCRICSSSPPCLIRLRCRLLLHLLAQDLQDRRERSRIAPSDRTRLLPPRRRRGLRLSSPLCRSSLACSPPSWRPRRQLGRYASRHRIRVSKRVAGRSSSPLWTTGRAVCSGSPKPSSQKFPGSARPEVLDLSRRNAY